MSEDSRMMTRASLPDRPLRHTCCCRLWQLHACVPALTGFSLRLARCIPWTCLCAASRYRAHQGTPMPSTPPAAAAAQQGLGSQGSPSAAGSPSGPSCTPGPHAVPLVCPCCGGASQPHQQVRALQGPGARRPGECSRSWQAYGELMRAHVILMDVFIRLSGIAPGLAWWHSRCRSSVDRGMVLSPAVHHVVAAAGGSAAAAAVARVGHSGVGLRWGRRGRAPVHGLRAVVHLVQPAAQGCSAKRSLVAPLGAAASVSCDTKF